jgi:hypothetical protein
VISAVPNCRTTDSSPADDIERGDDPERQGNRLRDEAAPHAGGGDLYRDPGRQQADGDVQRAAAHAGRLEGGRDAEQQERGCGRPEHSQDGDEGEEDKVDAAARFGSGHQPLAREAREDIGGRGGDDDGDELPDRIRRGEV